jgi:O-antigen/teichoic acid export membrane protein
VSSTAPQPHNSPAGHDGDSERRDAQHAARGGGTNILTVIAGLILPAFHTVAARLYGAATYGLYSLSLGITEIIAKLSAVGTDKGLMRHIPYHRVADEEPLVRASLRTGFWLSVVGGSILAALAMVFAEPLAAVQRKPDTVVAIRLLAPSTPFLALIVVLISATMGAKIMRFNLFVRGLAQPLLLLAVAAPVALFSPTLSGLCASHLVATVLTAGLALAATTHVFRDIPLSRALLRPDRSEPRFHWEMVQFSIPMGMSEFLNQILTRADIILLSLYVPKEQVGIYAGAELLSRAVSNARYAFDPVASPVLSEALRQGDRARLRYNLQLMTRWVTLLTFPIVTFVLGFRVELLTLFGEEFVAASTAFIILNVAHLINSTFGLTGWVIAMSGRSTTVLLNNLLSAAANILLCLLLIPRFGLVGAALSAACAFVLIQLLQLAEVGVLARVHPFSGGLIKVAIAGGFTLALAIFLSGTTGGPVVVRLVVGTVAMVVTYGFLLVLLRLPREEREIAARLWARLRRRS